jgi:hypothetical protein
MHIDPADGALFIADVGQVEREEINRIGAPCPGCTSANMGWPWYEDSRPVQTCGPTAPTGLTFPIATLTNPPNLSIISLGVYRAPAGATDPLPAEYEGDYFFSDYSSGVVRRIGWDGAQWVPKPAAGQPTADDWATGAKEIVDAAVGPDGAFWYLIQGVNLQFNTGAVHRVTASPPVTAVEPRAPNAIQLATPSPNPMRDAAAFEWSLAREGPVTLTIHDLAGRRVATLESGEHPAGPHRSRWDGRDGSGALEPPGVYIARLVTRGEWLTARFVLAR